MPVIEGDAAQSREAIVIDVVSDVVCPWCYIGKRKLEAALGELAAQDPAPEPAVRWHPFQLNPEAPIFRPNSAANPVPPTSMRASRPSVRKSASRSTSIASRFNPTPWPRTD
jgi:predicted DsbA family dithiol-disulfide isomerase